MFSAKNFSSLENSMSDLRTAAFALHAAHLLDPCPQHVARACVERGGLAHQTPWAASAHALCAPPCADICTQRMPASKTTATPLRRTRSRSARTSPRSPLSPTAPNDPDCTHTPLPKAMRLQPPDLMQVEEQPQQGAAAARLQRAARKLILRRAFDALRARRRRAATLIAAAFRGACVRWGHKAGSIKLLCHNQPPDSVYATDYDYSDPTAHELLEERRLALGGAPVDPTTGSPPEVLAACDCCGTTRSSDQLDVCFQHSKFFCKGTHGNPQRSCECPVCEFIPFDVGPMMSPAHRCGRGVYAALGDG